MRGPDQVRKMQKPLRVGEVSGVSLLAPQALIMIMIIIMIIIMIVIMIMIMGSLWGASPYSTSPASWSGLHIYHIYIYMVRITKLYLSN